MIVLDASAAIDWLLRTPAGQRVETRIYSRQDTLHAPHLIDVEVAQVLRRLARQGVICARGAEEAIHDLINLRITRYSHLALLPGIWKMRNKFSAHDAAYVVLAQKLGATLVTRDGRLAAAAGYAAPVELF